MYLFTVEQMLTIAICISVYAVMFKTGDSDGNLLTVFSTCVHDVLFVVSWFDEVLWQCVMCRKCVMKIFS